MDIKSFFNTLWNIFEKIFPYLIVAILIINITQCNDSRRYNEQLNNLESTINSIEQSINDVGTRLGQQESIIVELSNGQSKLESTVDEIRESVESANRNLDQLIGNEQDVDGSVGAIRGTVKQLTDSIDITIRGIEESGIE